MHQGVSLGLKDFTCSQFTFRKDFREVTQDFQALQCVQRITGAPRGALYVFTSTKVSFRVVSKAIQGEFLGILGFTGFPVRFKMRFKPFKGVLERFRGVLVVLRILCERRRKVDL